MYPLESNGVANRTGPLAQPWSRWIGRSVATLIVLMMVYVAATLWSARGALSTAIRSFPLEVLPSVLALVLLGLSLRALRWHYYVRRLAWPVPLGRSVLVFLVSFAFTATPGRAGEAIKAVLLRSRDQVPISAGVGALLVERLGDLIAVLILSVGSLGLMTGATRYLLPAAILIAALTLFAGVRHIHEPLLARAARVRSLRGIAQRVSNSLTASRELLKPAPLLIGVGIALMAWSCEAAAFYRLARDFGIGIGPWQASSIFGAATLAGALSALPGGLGGFEVTMVLLLHHLGFAVSAAMPPVMIFRLCTLWFGILIGVLSLLAWILLVRSAAPRDALVSGEIQ
ncbi:MAG: lysylphosphatidylglycerol synthase transmembrane domain-containing protein [Steroidobacteraceae bacterium]